MVFKVSRSISGIFMRCGTAATVLAGLALPAAVSVGQVRSDVERRAGSSPDSPAVQHQSGPVGSPTGEAQALPDELVDLLPERGLEAVTALIEYLKGGAVEAGLNELGITGNVVGLAIPAPVQPERASAAPSEKEAARIRAQTFRRLQARARAEGSVRIIAQVEVPNIQALTQAALAAADSTAASVADGQLSRAISATVQQELARLAGTQHRVHRTYETIPFVALQASPDALTVLERSSGIIGVNEDYVSRPMLNNSTGQIGADNAWDMGFDGSGQFVAILDTGVLASHEMFAGKTIVQSCFASSASGSGGDCPNGEATDNKSEDAARPYPSNFAGFDHGTHVAGIACGNAPDPGVNLSRRGLWKLEGLHGVARGADLVAMQVFHKVENSTSCGTVAPSDCVLSFSSDQAAALEFIFILKRAIDVAAANMSLGGGKFSSQSSCDGGNPSVKAAIDNLRAVGTATVIASGNDGFCDGISGPGCISSAIAVGAVDGSDNEAGFSNYLDSLLDIYAPGVQIRSAVASGNSDYGKKSGTSMATPHVCGAFAVLKQASPTASVDAILQALQSNGPSIAGRCVGTPNERRIQVDDSLFRHNGRIASSGSGEVEADLFWTSVWGGFFSTRQFFDLAGHMVREFYPRFVDVPVLTIELAIRNETGVAWTGYQVELLGSDFYGLGRAGLRGLAARENDPVVGTLAFSEGDILFLDDRGDPGEITLAGSWIERSGENAILTVAFDDPVDPGEAFLLAYFVRDVGYRDTHFTLISTPLE